MDEAWVNSLQGHIMGTQVGITVDIGRTHLSVKDFLNLRTGDIIVLKNDFKNALIANAEGIPLYEGFAGRFELSF